MRNESQNRNRIVVAFFGWHQIGHLNRDFRLMVTCDGRAYRECIVSKA